MPGQDSAQQILMAFRNIRVFLLQGFNDILDECSEKWITGEIEMGDTGKNDKVRKEQRKKPKHTIKEKRKIKQEKKSNTTGSLW